MARLKILIFTFVALCFSTNLPVLAETKEYSITKKLSCYSDSGTLYIVKRGKALSDKARRKLIVRLRRKINRVESDRKAEALEGRLDLIRDCTGESDGNGDGDGNSPESPTTPPSGDKTLRCPSAFSKQVHVFGVRICATKKVSSEKLLHAGRIMAEYLDNDEDGVVDDEKVLAELLNRKALLIMFKNSSEEQKSDYQIPDGEIAQPLFDVETIPHGAANGEFDFALEEVLHIISSAGYHYAYPNDLGEDPGSRLTNAMDLARGGRFSSVPNPYPSGAWYTYDDTTCEYICMASEYLYWALTSILGAQDLPGRLESIDNEWRPNTRAKVQETDPAVFELLTDPTLKLPTKIPDGVYNGGTISLTSR